jgi:HEXXH motif-containing protein
MRDIRLDRAWLLDRIVPPHDQVRAELTARGFKFRDVLKGNALRLVLECGARLLATTPSLETAVERSVSEIVLLDAQPSYDVSHSEPRWPETIFVSVPNDERQVSALRAIENIIHEAMHLQLTALEHLTPLIADKTSRMSSPWREEPRHLRGVFHGAYVFKCISTFFDGSKLSEHLDNRGAEYVARRRQEIAKELQQIQFERLAAGSTVEGRNLLNALLLSDTRAARPAALR